MLLHVCRLMLLLLLLLQCVMTSPTKTSSGVQESGLPAAQAQCLEVTATASAGRGCLAVRLCSVGTAGQAMCLVPARRSQVRGTCWRSLQAAGRLECIGGGDRQTERVAGCEAGR